MEVAVVAKKIQINCTTEFAYFGYLGYYFSAGSFCYIKQCR